jgi:hypothetical protein
MISNAIGVMLATPRRQGLLAYRADTSTTPYCAEPAPRARQPDP